MSALGTTTGTTRATRSSKRQAVQAGPDERALKKSLVESNQAKIDAFDQYINGTRDLEITFTYEKKSKHEDKWSLTVFGERLNAPGIGDPTHYNYEISDFIMNKSEFQTMMKTSTHPGMPGTQIPYQSIVGSLEHNTGIMMSWFPEVTNYLQVLRILLVYYIVYAVAINYIIYNATNKPKAIDYSNNLSQIYNDILHPVFSSLNLSLKKGIGRKKTTTINLEQNKINELIVSLLKKMKETNKLYYSQIITDIVTNLEKQSQIDVENADVQVESIIGVVENMELAGMEQSGGSRKKKRSKKRNKKRSKQKKKLKRKIMSKKRRR
jgi:hypothetical protein